MKIVERVLGEMKTNKVKCIEMQIYQLEKLREAMEQGRRLPLISLPTYSGDNYGFDEWVEKTNAIKI